MKGTEQMKNDINDPRFAGDGPSAAYAFERNRVLHEGGTPEAAHAAGLKAHLSQFGKDGIGTPGNTGVNHFNAILKYEGRDAYDRAVRAEFKRDAAYARSLGLVEPPRIGQ
jgi:hypothetical protein